MPKPVERYRAGFRTGQAGPPHISCHLLCFGVPG